MSNLVSSSDAGLMSGSMSNKVFQNELPLVINTRPIERAAPLTAYLQNKGFKVVDIPMLTLQMREVLDTDRDIMRQWLAGRFQALVVVSPTAAESGLAVWWELTQTQKNHPKQGNGSFDHNPPSSIIAVGDATAAVLKAANKPVQQPLIANNEGMLAMPEIARLQAGDSLLVWRGLGGRRLLVDTLQARGVHIESIAWYERTMPEFASSEYHQWLNSYLASHPSVAPLQPKPIVIISSGTAFEHWVTVVLQAHASYSFALKLSHFSYVVLGVRLAEMVAEKHLDYWQVEDLAPATIAAAISTQPARR